MLGVAFLGARGLGWGALDCWLAGEAVGGRRFLCGVASLIIKAFLAGTEHSFTGAACGGCLMDGVVVGYIKGLLTFLLRAHPFFPVFSLRPPPPTSYSAGSGLGACGFVGMF